MIARGVTFDSGYLRMVLSQGHRGPAVAAVQNLLKSHGFDDVGPSDGVFGPRTHATVVHFQQASGITVDGVVGPVTWAHLAVAQPPADPDPGVVIRGTSRGQEVLEVASRELGVIEEPDGSNGGPRVDVYTGNWRVPWCALFVSWVLRQTSFNPWPSPIAAVVKVKDWAERKGIYKPTPFRTSESTYQPKPGDIFIILKHNAAGVDTGHGHTGFVLSLEGDEIRTIEGNTSNGVRSRLRPIKTIAGFVPIDEV